MHPVLEYIAIGVLIALVLLAATQMIESPLRTAENVKAEQLFTVAERLMDKILLTPGYPYDWGSNTLITQENLTDFGIALAGAAAPYIVDPDKVMRLANLSILPNPMPVDAEKIAELLGIKGKYGFRLEMKPLITARVNTTGWTGNIASRFEVQVVNFYGVGLPNAKVSGLYVVALLKGGAGQAIDLDELKSFSRSCVTDAIGFCTLDYSGDVSSLRVGGGQFPSTFLVLHINWEGFVSVVGYSPDIGGSPVSGYIIGSNVFIERPEDAAPGAVIVKDEIVQVVPQYSILLEPTDVIWCRSMPNDPEWCHEVAGNVLPSRRRQGVNYLIGKVVYLEMLSSHVIIFGKWRGDWRAIVISRIPEIDISFGPTSAQPVNAVTLTRIAQIYNYPYVVRLTVWRWSEGLP
ncbi:MAG: hypothetical protein QXS92_04695 [Thermofilum sp.]